MSFQPPAIIASAPLIDFKDPHVQLQRSLRVTYLVIGGLIVLLILMASVIQTRGAVIGIGKLSVESSVKHLAHPTGGVISAIYVKEGDRVRKGDPIMRFDSTVSGGSASMLGQSLEQLLAARARLTAERDGMATIDFPPELRNNPSPTAVAAMQEATRQFQVRAQLRMAEEAGIRERIAQTEQEAAATRSQMDSARKQSALIEPELDSVRSLYDRKLVTITRLNQMERTAADLNASAASSASNIARLRARVGELRVSMLEMQRTARTQAAQELAAINAQLGDQKIRSIAATDAAERSLLRAPHAGIVEKLAYKTIGGVVPPAQTIAEVVPDGEPLIIEAAVSPNDIDQIQMGQSSTVLFTSLNRQTTPELKGTLYYVAAEPTVDERTGASYYPVRIRVPEAELKRLNGLQLKSGMPAETFFSTGKRSLISYLLKPLLDQFNRAFRE
jgi:HlyD family secretion protein